MAHTWMLHPGDISLAPWMSPAQRGPSASSQTSGKPEAALQLGSVGLGECGRVMPMERRARQSCSTGYSVQKPFLALFTARGLEAGGAPLNTALRQGCPALAPLTAWGCSPCAQSWPISHIPYSALHRDQTQWPGSVPGMTTCGLLPLLQHLLRHCQQPLLCHGDAKDPGLWHRQAGEVGGKKRSVGRH